jgi:hypothetical protein
MSEFDAGAEKFSSTWTVTTYPNHPVGYTIGALWLNFATLSGEDTKIEFSGETPDGV